MRAEAELNGIIAYTFQNEQLFENGADSLFQPCYAEL